MGTASHRFPPSSAPFIRHCGGGDNENEDEDEDDDFQIQLTQTPEPLPKPVIVNKTALKPSNSQFRPSKKPKFVACPGKENAGPVQSDRTSEFAEALSLESVPSTIDCSLCLARDRDCVSDRKEGKEGLKASGTHYSNSIEARLLGLRSKGDLDSGRDVDRVCEDLKEDDGELGSSLLRLCDEVEVEEECCLSEGLILCPLCGIDISGMSEDQRQVHTNACLDEDKTPDHSDFPPNYDSARPSDGSERISSIDLETETYEEHPFPGDHPCSNRRGEMHLESSSIEDTVTNKSVENKLITDYFGSVYNRKKENASSSRDPQCMPGKSSVPKHPSKSKVKARKSKDIPSWCCIPGTPFRVDAFKYLRADCSHWFLTHFHIDHYQGLTRSFCHGKIYCSSITAKLVNLKLGIPWDRLQVLPLNEKTSVAGVQVTCIDANHCPGSIIILFVPPNGKAVLHTGDFRFSEEMANLSLWKSCSVHTLILDTTYCNPQYDFPKQEAVIQFVIEAIQAETFNNSTLFLIGSYTIGKERLFLQVARMLRKKVYVTSSKLRLLECLGFSEEDMQWFTGREEESNIHVVPMWMLASFKRLKCISNQYASRFSLIVAFSPTGWTFGKGKKKCPGRRWKQGTMIRYEVPYSEHCSFTELKEFVEVVCPQIIIPSVNNDGPESASAMVSLLLS